MMTNVNNAMSSTCFLSGPSLNCSASIWSAYMSALLSRRSRYRRINAMLVIILCNFIKLETQSDAGEGTTTTTCNEMYRGSWGNGHGSRKFAQPLRNHEQRRRLHLQTTNLLGKHGWLLYKWRRLQGFKELRTTCEFVPLPCSWLATTTTIAGATAAAAASWPIDKDFVTRTRQMIRTAAATRMFCA